MGGFLMPSGIPTMAPKTSGLRFDYRKMIHMSNQIVIVGNLGKDPEIRVSKAGNPVASFNVCDTPRKYNKDTQQYDNGEGYWQYCRAFKHLADHIGKSFKKGDQVIVVGRIETSKWQDQQTGEEKQMNVLIVDEVGPSLRFGTTVFTKSAGGQSTPPIDSSDWDNRGNAGAPLADDPWGNAQAFAGGDNSDNQDPPF